MLPNKDDTAKDLGVLNIANALPQSLAPAMAPAILAFGANLPHRAVPHLVPVRRARRAGRRRARLPDQGSALMTGVPGPRRRPVDERVEDLLGRMTLEEKAGQLFQHMITIGAGRPLAESDPVFGLPSAKEYVLGKHMTHFNLLGRRPATRAEIAEWHNRLQALAQETRLGIPVTIATDPRHAFTDNPGTALLSGPFSQWPETLGLAATRDEALVEQHARHRPSGVPGRRHAHRAAPAGRPGHRAALGARQRHVRRGRRR